MAVLAVVLVAAVAYQYFATFSGGRSLKPDVWGQFGDYMGGTLNPILAFFAFLALLFTIIFQSHELQATRQELSRTVEAAKHQTFEATLFQLIRLYNDNIAGIGAIGSYRGRDRLLAGRDAMHKLAEELSSTIKEARKEAANRGTTDDPLHNFSAGFVLLQQRREVNLNHLFFTLHEIIWFVEQERSDADRDKYVRIVRAQLTTAELMLLVCFCVSDYPQSIAMKQYVERYSMLGLMTQAAQDKVRKLRVFAQTAFQSSTTE